MDIQKNFVILNPDTTLQKTSGNDKFYKNRF